METMETLIANTQNYGHIKKYGISYADVNSINDTIFVLESTRSKDVPIKGDIIQCSAPNDGMIKYPNGHLDRSIETEFASICVQPYAPFVFHGRTLESLSFSCSGGYWIREQELEMYELQGYKTKTFCQWGECGACAGGAIYFQAIVNVWRLLREDIY